MCVCVCSPLPSKYRASVQASFQTNKSPPHEHSLADLLGHFYLLIAKKIISKTNLHFSSSSTLSSIEIEQHGKFALLICFYVLVYY